MLKSWAVRQLAAALGDYLEGVTPDSVHASLGTDTGKLDLKARVSPVALKKFGLDLISSEVDLHVHIPWRHLESQATEFSVRSLQLEVRLVPPGSEPPAPVDIAAERKAKEAAVQRLTESGTAVQNAGRAARASHAILRQLRASVKVCEVKLNCDEWHEEPLCLALKDAKLLSVGSDWKSAPDPNQTDLNKVFKFHELSVRRGTHSREPIFGPVGMEVRLLHAPVKQLLHLSATTTADASYVRVAASMVTFFRRMLSIALAPNPHEVVRPVLPEAAGHEYAKLYSRRIGGESFDEPAKARIQEIEDLAPAEWIAAWRGHVHKLQARPSTSFRSAGKVASESESAGKPKKRENFWGWTWGSKDKEEHQASQAGKQDTAAPVFDDLLEEAIATGLAPEVSLPSRIVLDAVVPRAEALCLGKSSPLGIELEGVSLHAELCAKAPVHCQTTARLWQVTSRVELGSLAVCLDRQKLVELRHVRQEVARQPDLVDGSLAELGFRPISEPQARENAVYLELLVKQRDIQVSGSPPFDLEVTLMNEPLTFHLNAWRVNSALSNMLEIMSALRDESEVPGVEPVTPAAASPKPLASAPRASLLALPSEATEEETLIKDVKAALADKSATVKLHIHVEAPIIHWQDREADVGFVMRLGCLRTRTRKVGDEEMARRPAEPVNLASLGMFCELEGVSIALVENGEEQWVYEPATMLLYASSESGSTKVQAEAPAVRIRCEPRLLRALGQLKWGLNYALLPLSEAAAPDTRTSAPGRAREERSEKVEEAPPSASSDTFLQAEVRLGQLELAWRSSDDAEPLRFGCGGVVVRVLKEEESVACVTSEVIGLELEAAGTKMVQCSEPFCMELNSSPTLLEVQLKAKPLEFRCSKGTMEAVADAVKVARDSFSGGMDAAGKLLPVSEDVSTVLWNKYVRERAEQLGGDVTAYVQAELQQLGLGSMGQPREQEAHTGEEPAGEPPVEEGGGSSSSRASHPEPAPPRMVRITTVCPALSLALLPAGRRRGAVGAVGASLVASKATVVLQWSPGEAAVGVHLASVMVDLGPRRILMPRRKDVDLLVVEASAKGKEPSVVLNWAQIVVVFRQRDLDEINFLLTDMANVFERKTGSGHDARTSSSPVPSTAAADLPILRYSFSVDAPLVYLPTDAYSHGRMRRASSSQGALLALVDGPPTPTSTDSFGTSFVHRAHQEAVAHLEVVDGEPVFMPAPGDGFLVIDFGHLEAHEGAAARIVELTLREAHVTAHWSTASSSQAQGTVLHPISFGLVVTLSDGAVEVQARLPLEDCSEGGQHMTLTRAQLTLLLDVAQLNFNYAPLEAKAALAQAQSTVLHRSGSGVQQNLEVHFHLEWRGPLRLDVGFTEQAPLASLELVDGAIDFQSDPTGMVTDIQISAVTGKDDRRVSRNADKLVLQGKARDGVPSFHLVSRLPSSGVESILEVDLEHPVLLLLPALFTDLSTWGLSAYQQSAMVNGPQGQGRNGGPAADAVVQHMVVRVRGAALKIPIRWYEPQDYLEVKGSLHASFVQQGFVTRIEALDLSGGRLLRVASGGPSVLLCGRLEICTRGMYQLKQDEANQFRMNSVSIELLTIKPTRICMAAAEHSTLVKAGTELSQLDADTTEPADELRQRDPLAFVMQQRFAVEASVEVCDVLLQLMEAVDTKGERVAVEFQAACPLLQVSVKTAAGTAPSASLKAEGLQIQLRSHNERAGDWEPVLAPSVWYLHFNLDPEKRGEALTLRYIEGSAECLDNTYDEGSIVSAWYGDRSCEPSPGVVPISVEGRGYNVTNAVKQLLRDGKQIQASNNLFKDPCPGAHKVLVVKLRQKAVARLELSCKPLQLVVTIPFLHLASRLLPALAGEAPPVPASGHSSETLLGLNLSGYPCLVCWKKGQVSSDVLLLPTSRQLPLDAVLRDWDGSGPLPRVHIWLAEAEKDVVGGGQEPSRYRRIGSPCEIFLEAEGAQVWQSSPHGLQLAARVIAPRPLQRLLVVSSPLHVANRTPWDIEVQFLRGDSPVPIVAPLRPRCVSGKSLNQDGWEEDGPPEGEVKPGMSRVTSGSFAVKAVEAPANSRRVAGTITIEVHNAEALGSPEYRVGDLMKRMLAAQDLQAYVLVRIGSREQETSVKRADRGRADFLYKIKFPLPEGATLDSLRGSEVKFEVYRKAPVTGALRGDPLIGAASVRLGEAELKGAAAARVQTLQLTRDRQEAQGRLQVRLWVEAQEVSSQAADASSAGTLSPGRPRQAWSVDVPECAPGIHRVPAGSVLAVPPEALRFGGLGAAPACRLQLRPFSESRTEGGWGDPMDSERLARMRDGTVTVAPHPDFPGQMFHLHVEACSSEARHELQVDAPFRIANACPCDVYCAVGLPRTQRLGDLSGNAPAAETIYVVDATGTEWEVPPGATVDVFPLQLDADRRITYYVGGDQRAHKVSCRPETNLLHVVRHADTLTWRQKRVDAIDPSLHPFRMTPQQEVPIFDVPPTGIMFTVALFEQYTGQLTKSSSPLPAIRYGCGPSTQATLQCRWEEEATELGASWQPGRRVVVFARNWFADATGQGVGLSCKAPHRKRLPCFGNGMVVCGDLVGESPEVALFHPDSTQPAVVQVPVLGSSVGVSVSSRHRCVLMMESVASTSTFGVPCRLMTLVPGMMVFNQMQDADVGFRPCGCKEVTWLCPGESEKLFWSPGDRRAVEVALRQSRSGDLARVVFSAPFEVAERTIGAYPLAFPEIGQARRLACLQVDQSGELFTVTVAGESECHQLVNRHPCLVLDAAFKGEEVDYFTVPYGERVALGRPCRSTAAQRDLLLLRLADTADPGSSYRMEIDLARASQQRVPRAPPGSRPRPSALVSVQLRARVAVITVTPVALATSAQEVAWGFEVQVKVPQLGISLIGERPRGEVFGISVHHLTATSRLTAAGLQENELIVESLQVDLQRPKPMPVVACVSKPVLSLSVVREDVAARDIRLRRVALQLGRLEVTAVDALMQEAQALGKAITVGLSQAATGSLNLDQALARAGVPYNLVCGGPPKPSSKCILHELHVSHVELRVFLRLSTSILGNLITALVTVLSLSSVMEVDGANVRLPSQRFFDCEAPFEGNVGALGAIFLDRYVKLYPKAVISLVNNSNLFLGGFFTRHKWIPKDRFVTATRSKPLAVKNGVVVPIMTDIQEFLALDVFGGMPRGSKS